MSAFFGCRVLCAFFQECVNEEKVLKSLNIFTIKYVQITCLTGVIWWLHPYNFIHEWYYLIPKRDYERKWEISKAASTLFAALHGTYFGASAVRSWWMQLEAFCSSYYFSIFHEADSFVLFLIYLKILWKFLIHLRSCVRLSRHETKDGAKSSTSRRMSEVS